MLNFYQFHKIKKMKSLKIIYSLIIIVGLSLFTSCEKVLDEKPFSELSDAQFWKNNIDADAGIISIYDAMQRQYRQRYFLWGEFRGDNHVASGTAAGGSLELLNNTLTAANEASLRWNELYRMISRANIAIEKIPQIPGFDKNLLAEAHILRAFAYFDAVRVWGAVPLFKEAVTNLDKEVQRPRTDALTIMNEVVIPDMLKAEELMTRGANQFRFSKWSVNAFQGLVYMFQKDYPKAKIALDKVVASKAYTLTTTREAWQKMFWNEVAVLGSKQMSGPELIFSIRYTLTEDADRSGVYDLFFAGLPNFYISPILENKWVGLFPTDSAAWVKKYPAVADLPKTRVTTGANIGAIIWGDWRYFDSRESGRAIGTARVAKYNKFNYSNNIDDTDIHIFRYAGILLMLAEAENQLWKAGNATAKTNAVNLVNQVRVARQLPQVKAADFTTADQLENYILDERSIELLGEGNRWWDLVRTGKAVSTMGPINGQTEKTIVFPIFQRHLIDNPLLTQNEGYIK
jgi:starch-binding outer membrane protein, SusD/RagB family